MSRGGEGVGKGRGSEKRKGRDWNRGLRQENKGRGELGLWKVHHSTSHTRPVAASHTPHTHILHASPQPLQPTRPTQVLHAVIGDPPYGVRAGGKKSGAKPEIADRRNPITDPSTHIPATQVCAPWGAGR